MKPVLMISLISLFLFGNPAVHAAPANTSAKTIATKNAVRDLWVDHVFWVRAVVIANASKNAKAEKQAELSVVDNAKKIAGVIEPFYGKPASDKLFGLLAGHYGAVKEYMQATMPNTSAAKQKAAVDKLTANAKEIAAFLSSANPNLPNDTLVSLLSAHGGHHIEQINEIKTGDYAAEAATWDAMKQHMYMISDALVDGIAAQFPEKF